MAKNIYKEQGYVEIKKADFGNSDFQEYLECGENRGIPFFFEEGEEFTFVDPEIFFGKKVKIRGKEYPQLFTEIQSNLRGKQLMPVATLRRLPELPSELKQLMEGNALGSLVLGSMPDIQRVLVMAAAAKDKKIRVSEILLHTSKWKDGERIPDSDSLPESERKQITCYKFNVAK